MGIALRYETTDGSSFTERREANKHQKRLDTQTHLAALMTANVDGLENSVALGVADFLVTAADPVKKALTQLKPQPLEDPTVFSALGLTAPEVDSEATAEEEGSEEEASESESEDDQSAEPQPEAPEPVGETAEAPADPQPTPETPEQADTVAPAQSGFGGPGATSQSSAAEADLGDADDGTDGAGAPPGPAAASAQSSF